MAPLQAAVTVRRNMGDDVRRRRRYDLDHEVGGYTRDRAEAALLPRADERARHSRVRDGAARGRKCEPAARTFGTARHRPGRRCPATVAERWAEQHERTATRLAHEPARRHDRPGPQDRHAGQARRGRRDQPGGPDRSEARVATRPRLPGRWTQGRRFGPPPRARATTGSASRREEQVGEPLRPR